MKGKRILVLLVVLFMCLLVAILTGVVAILLTAQYSQNQKISDLQNQLLNSISNSTDTTNTTNSTNSTDTSNTTQVEWKVVSKSDNSETADYKVNIVYPFLTNSDQLDIANHVNNLIKNQVNNYKETVTSMADDSYAAKPYVSLDYEVKFLSNNFVSIVISGSQYLGGAHPGSVFVTINYDLKNDTALDLSDVFNSGSDYLSELSTSTRSELATMLGVGITDSQLVAGTAEDADNFELFYLTGDEQIDYLGIIFGEYQVAPYAAGPQVVELNAIDFEDMFNSEFTSLF